MKDIFIEFKVDFFIAMLDTKFYIVECWTLKYSCKNCRIFLWHSYLESVGLFWVLLLKCIRTDPRAVFRTKLAHDGGDVLLSTLPKSLNSGYREYELFPASCKFQALFSLLPARGSLSSFR